MFPPRGASATILTQNVVEQVDNAAEDGLVLV